MAVLVTLRPDGEPSTSVVTAVPSHPVTGEQVVAFVARGATAEFANLRRLPRATLVFRSSSEPVAVIGPVERAGPDDDLPGLGADALSGLLREVFHAAGGARDDLDTHDRIMTAERRTAVLLRPRRTDQPVRVWIIHRLDVRRRGDGRGRRPVAAGHGWPVVLVLPSGQVGVMGAQPSRAPWR